jgi:hypothetical protein
VGEEIDERAGGRFYGIAVGIDSVRLDGSQGPRREKRGLSNKVALPRSDAAHHSRFAEI